MRAAHALPLSQLESMTLSSIPLFGVTDFFWWYKQTQRYPDALCRYPSIYVRGAEAYLQIHGCQQQI